MHIELAELLNDLNTYPSWTTGNEYPLQVRQVGDYIEVFYTTSQGKTFTRAFPAKIELSNCLAFSLGLIKGEGANAKGKSNYRRFHFTNANPMLISHVLRNLEKSGLLEISSIKAGAFHLLHFKDKESAVVTWWAKQLSLSPNYFRCFESEKRTTSKGVCHLYISDVLLRRVVDALIDFVMKT
ncbi:MAG: hypothetical protein ABIA93_03780 [Candidatus Woesearchaeota archaeon]